MLLRPTHKVRSNVTVLSVCPHLHCLCIAANCLLMVQWHSRKSWPALLRWNYPFCFLVHSFEPFLLVFWNDCRLAVRSMNMRAKKYWWRFLSRRPRSSLTSVFHDWLTAWTLLQVWYPLLWYVCARSTGMLFARTTGFPTRKRQKTCPVLVDQHRWFAS